MRLPFARSLSPIGLDLGAHTIKAVQFENKSHAARLVASCCLPRKSPGSPVDRDELSRLAAGLARQGFIGGEVVLAMPASKTLTSVLELPARSSELPMDEIACAEFCRIHKTEPHAITMAYWDLPHSTRASRSTFAMSAGWLSSEAEQFLDMVQDAGLTVVAVDVNSSATARTAGPSSPGNMDMTGILDLGWTSAVASIVRSGTLIYERRIPEAGLIHLVNSFLTDASIDRRDAQYLIEQVGMKDSPQPQSGDADIDADCRAKISAHCVKMDDEIRQALSYACHQYPDDQAPGLLLAGGGACIPELAPFLQKQLRMQVRVADPLAAMSCAPEQKGKVNASMLTAIGLARFGCEMLATHSGSRQQVTA
ncbi:MAG: pilus assembly protein PilM [Planctomycetota bacterium]|nr:pilus assembly protein PilM [Planctomycetota bacterium]